MDGRLAIDGGTRAIPEPLPSASGGPGANVAGEEEIQAIAAVIRDCALFRHNPASRTRRFERESAEKIGVRHALAVNSGTSALICGLIGLGIGPGDEVIVPAYTYISTAAAVVAVGAVPVIAEIDESLGLDPADFERKLTRRTKAVIPVYMQGVPARISAILDVARRHDIAVLEDCCQCIGGEYRGRMVGTFGAAGAWSLNYFKVITCGEGGLLFTDSDLIFDHASLASDPGLPMWARDSVAAETRTERPFVSQCYRVSEIIGAMALVQLHRLDPILAHTRALKRAFRCALDDPKGYVPQHVDDPAGDCGTSAAIIVHTEESARRYAEALTAEGLPCGTAHNDGFPDRHIYRYWDAILEKNSAHPAANPWTAPAYDGDAVYDPEMCPRTMSLLNRSLRVGFNMGMTEEHAKQMAAAINKVDAALAG